MPDVFLNRFKFTPESTLGALTYNGNSMAFILEDTVRVDDPSTPQNEGEKVYGKTAIPAGRYRLVWDYSPKFKKKTLHIMDVPGYDGIRFHGGNHASDSLGCLLCGHKASMGEGDILSISDCAPAIEEVESVLVPLAEKGNFYITIGGKP